MNQETSNEDKSDSLNKTKAKKSLILTFDKEQKVKILKDLKKNYPESSASVISDDDNIKLTVEFNNYKDAKDAKTLLAKLYKNDTVKIESLLFQLKKEKRKHDKSETKENRFVEQNGQLGDRSRNLFEIRIPKIIIRNLSFKFNDESLKKEMEKFGQVELINLPKKEGQKNHNGFGFVTFKKLKDAQKAIETLNAKTDKLNGTKVAADWCLPKNLYLKNTTHNQNSSNGNSENGQSDNESEENNEKDDQKLNDEDQEEDKENSSDEEEKETKKIVIDKKKTKFELKKKVGTQDIQEKRTVFVRNLSFDAVEEDVKETFSKYGPVKYVKLCYDKDLERPRGTAFIQFEDSQSALNACAESEILEMDMRKLQIDMAISRTQVNDILEEKKSSSKETKDNRNLGLLKEGTIYANSYEAKNISKADMLRRQKLESDNAEKLKLLHYFVSPTRLSVHNIPISCTDEQFRKIFYDAISNISGSDIRTHRGGIKECRIMRDLSRVNAEGVGRSKGYGFVEFTSFELAKKALHATNNNEKLFPNGSRLIVQFSVEDMRALKKKEARLAKSKLKLNMKRNSFDRFKKKPENKSNNKNGFNNQHDQEENIDKLKQKNLLKVHSLERKLQKRKNDEVKKVEKKQKKFVLNEKKLIEKADNIQKKNEIIKQRKIMHRKNKKLNKKTSQIKKAAKQTVDNVDKLVDKLYNSKNKIVKKKWYD